MRKIVFLALLSLVFVSCKRQKSRSGGGDLMYYCIKSYMEGEEIVARHYEEYAPLYINIGFDGTEYLPYPDENDERGDKFRELSLRYGDTHCYEFPFGVGEFALCNEFTSMDIVSDSDFNGISPGSSLSGVVKFVAASVKPYIDSDYTYCYNWREETPADYVIGNNKIITDGRTHPVYGFLDKIQPEQLKLLSRGSIWFKFVEEPAIKQHTFTITFREGDKTLSCEVECSF